MTTTTETPKQTAHEIADEFKARVAGVNHIVACRMKYNLDAMEEIHARDRAITDDIDHAQFAAYNVVMFDEINQIAVVEDRIAARKGEYKYTTASFHEKIGPNGKWRTSSNYWHKMELAYMQGIAEKILGLNNQFAVFAERMLTEVK